MRIAVVTSFPPPASGVADYGVLLCREFAADRQVERVTVIADGAETALAAVSDGAIEVRRVWTRDRVPVRPILREITASRSDVVWFNVGLTMFGTRPAVVAAGLSLPLAARLLGYRVVVTLHEMPALADLAALGLARRGARIAGWAAVRLLLAADAVVVTLDRYRRYLEAHHRAGNVVHIRHGLWEPPRRPGVPDPSTVVVFGSFGPHKDPAFVARAVERIRRPGRPVRLIVAGSDHPRYPGFMETRRALLAADDTQVVGRVPPEGLEALFSRATCVVVPSTASSGSSGVIHRALGYGRALIVSDLADHRALADEEGLEFAWSPPRDVGGLSRAIGTLLDDPAERARIVEHNLRAAARMAPRRTADAYLRVLAGALPDRTAVAPVAAVSPLRSAGA